MRPTSVASTVLNAITRHGNKDYPPSLCLDAGVDPPAETRDAGILMKRPLLAASLLLTPLASAADSADWTGVWDTQWRGGGAVMELRQDDDHVEGSYPGFEGVVQGRIDGKTLFGTWEDAAGNGVFTFVMAPDQQSFMGRFGTGEWWTGMRTDTHMAATLFGELDSSSPELTLKSFLRAGNAARGGRSDRLGVVTPLLDFTAHGEALTAYQRIDLARQLFQIIDRMTFRIWELRPNRVLDSGEDYIVELSQAGSQLGQRLTFRAGGDRNGEATPNWRIVVPPQEELQESTPFFQIRNQVRSVHREPLQESGAGMELWQWLALMLWLLFSIAISWLLTCWRLNPSAIVTVTKYCVPSPCR